MHINFAPDGNKSSSRPASSTLAQWGKRAHKEKALTEFEAMDWNREHGAHQLVSGSQGPGMQQVRLRAALQKHFSGNTIHQFPVLDPGSPREQMSTGPS